jgi:hypothetical protein
MTTDTEQLHTVLDDLNLIEKVENETPWNTADLAAFLIPFVKRHNGDIGSFKISILNPQPGVKREEQPLVKIGRGYNDKGVVTIRVLSPKRAAARTDLLDRLSLADDLKPKEAAMPAKLVMRLAHALDNIHNYNSYSSNGLWRCAEGHCKCNLAAETSHLTTPIIRGDTTAKTKPRKTIKRLKLELQWAEDSYAKALEKAEKEKKKADRLRQRIAKREAQDELLQSS